MIDIREILPILSIGTLTKIKNKCEAYNTYCIDYKQVNSKCGVRTRQKDYAELLEAVMSTIAMKQFEEQQANCTKNGDLNNNNVTSTAGETQTTAVESKKKEKKK